MYPTTDDTVNPVLSDLMVPSELYLQTDIDYPVSVTVTDPQGIEDVRIVEMFIFPENNSILLADTMKDDGTMGDIIPGDGIYTYGLEIDFAAGNTGTYRVGIVAGDAANHSSDTLFASFTVEPGVINSAPVLSNPVVPDTLREENLDDVFLSVGAVDLQGQDDVDSVRFQVYPPTSPVPYYSGHLRDDGSSGDLFAGDSIFSVRVSLVDRLKDPPVLSDLVAPATVSRSVGQLILLSVKVADAQGPGDIKSVYFNTTKPSGLPAENNPFFMFDDGETDISGDGQAGDGTYSLLIVITGENETGDYKFDFYAEDFSRGLGSCLFRFQAEDKNGSTSQPLVAESVARLEGAVSVPISHIMTVVE